MTEAIDEHLALIRASGILFDDDEDTAGRLLINLNDVFGWACADAEEIPQDKIAEVADLFGRYGWAGVLFWVSERRGYGSEFHDVNRFIEFVRREEQLRKDVPSSSKRAYTKLTYTLGGSKQ